MADDKPATQAERIAALEEKTAELDAWSDEVQAWIDQHSEATNERAGTSTDRLSTLELQLAMLLDDRFGKNVRPAVFDVDGTPQTDVWTDTRVPDPDDADNVDQRPQDPTPAQQSNQDGRVARLEAQLAELLAQRKD